MRTVAALFSGMLSLCLPMAASAETVGTLSAAGPNRLNMDAWPANGWSVKRYENLVEITFPSSGFDLVASAGLAEGLGPRVEVVEVDVLEADSILRLTLNCACPIALDGDGATRLTISVVDTSSTDRHVRREPGDDPAPNWAPKPSARPTDTEVAEPILDNEPLDVDEARARLLEQLMRAAEAGIVELEPDVAAQHQEQVKEEPTNSTEDPYDNPVDEVAEQTEGSPEIPDDDVENEEARAAASEDTSVAEEPRTAMAKPSLPPACFDSVAFMFPDLPDPRDFLDMVSKHRAGLIGEFDRPDPKIALELARAYLSVGLTAEARSVAVDFAPDLSPAQLISEMAEVVDGEPLPKDANLLLADCDGDQALWRAAALASGGAKAEEVLSAELISGRALERLPVFLREAVAARIGSVAANAGDWDTARRMEAMALRAASGRPELQGETLLLSAQLADWNEEPDKAWSYRQRALKSHPKHADSALLQLAETVLSSEKYLGASTENLQLDLGALAIQARGTPTGQRAFELEARLLARAEGRDDLIALLAESDRSDLLPEEKQVALLSELMEDRQLDELSRPIGLIYLEDPDRFAEAMEQPAFRRSVIRSLAELGLPGLAEPLLRSDDEESASLYAAISSAYLAVGDSRNALDLAQEMTPGATRDAAIAMALASLGQTGQSSGMLERLAGLEQDDAGVIALEKAVDAAANAGDMVTAMAASAKLLEADPTRPRAEERVMIALLAGASEFPADARRVLEETAPDRVEKLDTLFSAQDSETYVDRQARAEETLERLDVELELLEGLLGDG